MEKLIIQLYRGLVESVYSNSSRPIDIQVLEEGEEHDEYRAQEYWQNKLLIECGCIKDILNETPQHTSDVELELSPMSKTQLQRITETICCVPKRSPLLMIFGFLAACEIVNRQRAPYAEVNTDKKGQWLNSFADSRMERMIKLYDEYSDELWKSSAGAASKSENT